MELATHMNFWTLLSKYQWKSLIKSKIHSYWISTISEVCNLYSSLKYLKGSYKAGQCHPLATTISANMRDIIRIPIRLKIATGTYILQANRASYNRSQLNPICLLCGNGEETLEPFLLTCNCLDSICAPLVKEIINTCSALFAKNKLDGNQGWQKSGKYSYFPGRREIRLILNLQI
jgi:hypothetical protein